MLKIGEFSRISQVTVKTLHHYDDIDLLKPAHIDQFTNYRYYSIEQIPRIHRIMVLKELGLSLEQIATMIDSELPTEQLIGMLALKEAEAQQRIDEEQMRLARIRFHIRQIDTEDMMSQLDIRIKKVDPLRALTLRIPIQREQLVKLGQEVEKAIAEHNITLAGPIMEIHYTEEFVLNFQDVEFVYPVDENWTQDIPLETLGTLTIKTIPGIEMAAVHIIQGVNLEESKELHSLRQRWVVEHGYQLGNTFRVVHHNGAMQHAEYEDWILEFQHPLVKATEDV